MASRSLDDLTPATAACARLMLARATAAGVDLLVTCTYRTEEEQAELYAKGRTTPGPIVTYAKPGESEHQKRTAIDVVPLVNGKPVWSNEGKGLVLWMQVGMIGKLAGLEWSGKWPKSVRELAHFQLPKEKTK